MPMNSYSVRLKQVVEEFNLIVARESSDYDRIDLMVEEVMRPGLPLAGFFTHFEPLRLQVIGNAEATYLHSLTPERRAETFDQLFSYHIPALVFARNIEPMPECMQMAEKHDITILRCLESTSYVVSSLITYLKNALAPRITRHGVFVEVYGEGLLLMGESGIGKSEAAAELLKRGHRLVADDAVEIRRISDSLYGSAPEIIRHYIEIRGIGIIDVQQLFGMGAVQFDSDIEIVSVGTIRKAPDTQERYRKAKGEADVYLVAEKMPLFEGKGTLRDFQHWVDARAAEYDHSGKVILTFIVEKNGSVAEVQVLDTPDPAMGEAAARIVASSPAWKAGAIDGEPVRVRYTLPVRCGKQAAPDETDDRGKRSENGVVVKVRNADFKASEALIFIDDKEATQTDMEKIDPDKIERISVYRDSSAVVRYGERGKNGVILIKMKQ